MANASILAAFERFYQHIALWQSGAAEKINENIRLNKDNERKISELYSLVEESGDTVIIEGVNHDLAIEDDGYGNVKFEVVEESGSDETEGNLETETANSTADALGNHFLTLSSDTLPHANSGAVLTVSTEASKVMRYGGVNWFPQKDMSVTGNTVITMPIELPRGYYALSTTIASWGVADSKPLVQILNASGAVIAQTVSGATGYNPSLTDSFGTGRYGARFYVDEPIAQIKIFSAANNATSIGKTTEFKDWSLWYSATGHAVEGATYDYQGGYHGVIYDVTSAALADKPLFINGAILLAEGGVAFSVSHEYNAQSGGGDAGEVIDGGELKTLTVNNRQYNSFIDKEVREDMESVLSEVSTLSSNMHALSGKVDAIGNGETPIYEDAPDYEYVSLNISGGWSDFTFVGDKLWVFAASDHNDHTKNDGGIYICNPTTGAVEKTLHHNFGHVNTVDYNSATDKLLVGNMPETPYSLYIFDGVSAWGDLANGSAVLLDSEAPVIVDVSKIASNTGTHANVPCACWGDSNMGMHNIVYFNGSYNKYWWKILLGTGTNNLGKGTYTAAASGEFNGTYKSLWSKTFTQRNYGANQEVTQGIQFVGGRVHTANGHNELQWWEWDFSNTDVTRREHNITVYKANGDINWSVSEGYAARDGYAYVGCIFTNENRAFTAVNGFIRTKIA